jgi:DNA modification methylase
MQKTYNDFLKGKQLVVESTGFEVAPEDINPMLFPFQNDLTRWAIRKGKSAIFADTGLGKTFMQLEWARLVNAHTGGRVLIVAPLSVAEQTIAEGGRLGIEVHHARNGGMDELQAINITNYEQIHKIDASMFESVVLDESSILKSLTGKIRKLLTEMFAEMPYRLCCTATPAPNDIAEIANHAEFLGVMSNAEMRAQFFIHDSSNSRGWRLKGWAKKGPFYRWMASWGMSIKRPSDLGYDDDGFILPELIVTPLEFASDFKRPDQLFFTGLKGIQDRNEVRRQVTPERIDIIAKMTNASDEQFIIWHNLNPEGEDLRRAIPDSVLVEGRQKADEKLAGIMAFLSGEARVLITKPKIAGFGMNFQHCSNVVYCGMSDSWEAYYQSIRRCYRFGQENPVNVTIVLADVERQIFDNVMAKEAQALEMSNNLIEHISQYERQEIMNTESQDWDYAEEDASGDGWHLMLGDSCERIDEMESESVDLSVFSPPFMSLYTYSPTERDLGNSRGKEEFFGHFSYIIDGLLRVTKPGRNCCVHVAQVPTLKHIDGYIGLRDFRGDVIRAFIDAGWIYYSEVAIDKNPQAQAIRTKAKKLMFVQKNKDSAASAPALADYILIFQKPGENAVPIKTDVTNEEWIQFAHPIWYDIRESDTLQYRGARAEDDERHIAPLQLPTIDRCVRLWSNPGETVFSPFAGIGSEGYQALKRGRKFLKEAEYQSHEHTLFGWAQEAASEGE